MKFNANTPNVAPMGPRAETEMKYKRSRANLLLVIIASVVNLFTLALNGSYFLFSASIPAIPVELAMPMSEEEAVVFSDFIVPIIIGVILTVPYLLCWIFSKKRAGWMIPALVFFSFDCLYLLLLATLDPTAVLFDILFHAWVMFYLITGVKHGFKLKNMPEDEPLPAFGETVAEGETPAETPAEGDMPAFDESLFEIAEEKNADEPVAARSFDEIMAENNKDGQ